MASSYPRFQQRKLATLEDVDMLKKEKKWKKVYTPVCVYVRPSKSIDSLSTFGVCESTTGVDSARIHFPYFSPTHTHSPPFSTSSSTRLFFPFLNRYGTRSSLLLLTRKRGRLLYVVDEGWRKYFHSSLLGNLVRIH